MADHIDDGAAPAAATTATTTANTTPQSATPAGAARRTARAGSFTFAGFDRAQLIALAALIAVLAWGAWVTRTLMAPAARHEFVQLELQGIISEYLQAQARSGNDEATAARQTGAFMANLDRIVASYGKQGKVVLVHQAVIGGELPDITPQVKELAYAATPLPAAPAPGGVQGQMQAFMQGNGGGNAPGL